MAGALRGQARIPCLSPKGRSPPMGHFAKPQLISNIPCGTVTLDDILRIEFYLFGNRFRIISTLIPIPRLRLEPDTARPHKNSECEK